MRQSLEQQIEVCDRRLKGHGHDPKSNPERHWRLLQRKAELYAASVRAQWEFERNDRREKRARGAST